MLGGIYAVVNKVNGKSYIGSAVDFRRRFVKHRHELKVATHHSQKLLRAWGKYGQESFEFRRLIICKPEHLLMYEQRCIDGFDSYLNGYNAGPSAISALGVKRGPDVRAKMSASATGRVMSREAVEKMRQTKLGRPSWNGGIPVTDEVKAKLRAFNLGRKHGPASPARLAAIHAGHFVAYGLSEEKILAMRAMFDAAGTTRRSALRREISDAFNVKYGVTVEIVARRRYKWIP